MVTAGYPLKRERSCATHSGTGSKQTTRAACAAKRAALSPMFAPTSKTRIFCVMVCGKRNDYQKRLGVQLPMGGLQGCTPWDSVLIYANLDYKPSRNIGSESEVSGPATSARVLPFLD